jgi:hypothetical protein
VKIDLKPDKVLGEPNPTSAKLTFICTGRSPVIHRDLFLCFQRLKNNAFLLYISSKSRSRLIRSVAFLSMEAHQGGVAMHRTSPNIRRPAVIRITSPLWRLADFIPSSRVPPSTASWFQ